MGGRWASARQRLDCAQSRVTLRILARAVHSSPTAVPGLAISTASAAMTEHSPGTPLLVFADDWGRHPSSCQHLIRALLAEHPVTWVNTIGTRPPRFDLATVRRGLGKLRQWTKQTPSSDVEAKRPRVVNPKMWPRFSTRLDRRINKLLLKRQLKPIVEAAPGIPDCGYHASDRRRPHVRSSGAVVGVLLCG